ncbi:MAG: DNA repair protein RecO [bacterium]
MSTAVRRARAIVLRRRETGERDVLLTLYSLEAGRMQMLVRGTQKPASTLRRCADLFNEGTFHFIPRRSVPLLNQWEPIETFDALKKDPGKLSLGFFMLKVIHETGVDGDPEPELYYLLKNLLWLLQNSENHDKIKAAFLTGVLEKTGFSVNWAACQGCGDDLAGECFLAVRENGFVCSRCAGRFSGAGRQPVSLKTVKIGKKIIKVLEKIVFRPMDAPSVQQKALRFFETFCARLSGCEREMGGLGYAVTRFFQYHVNENVTHWYVSL